MCVWYHKAFQGERLAQSVGEAGSITCGGGKTGYYSTVALEILLVSQPQQATLLCLFCSGPLLSLLRKVYSLSLSLSLFSLLTLSPSSLSTTMPQRTEGPHHHSSSLWLTVFETIAYSVCTHFS